MDGSRAVSVFTVLFTALACGCGTSRWAMDDEDYARKYSQPYDGDKLPRMAKQSVDARHVRDKSGVYFGGAGQNDPGAGGLEVGLFAYDEPWLSGRVGLAVLGSEAAEDLFAGLNTGLRVQPPARIAPFAGVGLFGGLSQETVDLSRDGFDNDGDGFVDEHGEDDKRTDNALAAVYPELGLHLWLNGHTRLTASAAYYITTLGRDRDFWFYGVNLSWLWGSDEG